MSKTVYRVLYVAIMGAALGGFVFFNAGNVPLAIALWVVAGAGVLGVVGTVAGIGFSRFAKRPQATVGGVVATTAAPASLSTVLAALDNLNDPDLPFEIRSEPAPQGAVVTVRWRIEKLRWQTLFTQGSVVNNWKMVVTLDEAKARYGFLEYTSQARYREGVWPPRVDWDWKGSAGKTAGHMSMHVVMTPGRPVETTAQGSDGSASSSVGATWLRPADAKVPVLTTLRNHGWRPRVDWAGARLFER